MEREVQKVANVAAAAAAAKKERKKEADNEASCGATK